MCLNNCIKGKDVLNCEIEISDYMLDMSDNCDYFDTNKTFEASPTDLLILHTNIRGISSKIVDLKYLLDNGTSNTIPDIVTVCETWLNPLSPDINLPGCNFVMKCRTNKKGGGVGILINTNHLHK